MSYIAQRGDVELRMLAELRQFGPSFKSRGVTIIELLVAIAVVGLLVSLLIPAVQSGREAARRASCQNNLRQIGSAVLNHESTHGRFPSNGWGFEWVGKPGRGTDKSQPGGWIYNILSYVDQQPSRDIGSGLTDAQRRVALAQLLQTPNEIFRCPSRPGPVLGPANPDVVPVNAVWQPQVAKTDYAVNEGDWISDTLAGPPSLTEGDRPDYKWRAMSKATGVAFQRSEIRPRDIVDGLSQTYLVGEKYVGRNSYATSDDSGYDQSMYSGVDLDLNRWTLETPLWDGDVPAVRSFGSAHPGDCYFVFCDGSVRPVSYSIDSEVHRAAGNRRDAISLQIRSLRP